MSLIRLNALDENAKRAMYAQLIPNRLWQHLAIVDPHHLSNGPDNPAAFRVVGPPDRAEVHLRCPAERFEGDYALSLDLEEAGAGQLELSFVIINDLTSPRYGIDVDEQGRVTLLGTASRNLAQEECALRGGLGPCQVRHGLRLFGDMQPRLEHFCQQLGYISIVLEPLTYHNAVMYERHGFAYIVGRKRMIQLNTEFEHGGRLHQLLDNRSIFRNPALSLTPRGRSWAIHDGILGDFDGKSHLDLQMVKVIGHDAHQHTFNAGGE